MDRAESIATFPDLKAIEEVAAEWVARQDTRPLGREEAAAFQEWLGQRQQHAEAYKRMSAIWRGYDSLDELNYIDHEIGDSETGFGRKQRFHWALGGIAAAAAVVCIAVFFQPFLPFTQSQVAHFNTSVGGQEDIVLVDGSTIKLNTDSELTIDISAEARTIRLLHGEAHFQVAHDPDRPFKVLAGDGAVWAVGTAFTIYLRDETAEVIVTEGAVKLFLQSDSDQQDSSAIVSWPDLKPTASLTAGQKAVFTGKIESLERLSQDVLDRRLLWRDGYVAFSGEPLSHVLTEIGRYSDIVIEVDDPELESTPIGGYFKVGDVEGVLEALENGFGVEVQRINASYVKLSQAQ
ncbi:MAG: FecR domain-containing protein [Xanthomonadales bacterium]|nr:FecR domain-containing protein [Xanthomonadales bacterium]